MALELVQVVFGQDLVLCEEYTGVLVKLAVMQYSHFYLKKGTKRLENRPNFPF